MLISDKVWSLIIGGNRRKSIEKNQHENIDVLLDESVSELINSKQASSVRSYQAKDLLMNLNSSLIVR